MGMGFWLYVVTGCNLLGQLRQQVQLKVLKGLIFCLVLVSFF